MKRNIQIKLVMSEDERAMLEEGASVRRRTFSDYIRWLISTDKDSKYRLTDVGIKLLEEAHNKKDGH